jgi:translation initiation factor 5A
MTTKVVSAGTLKEGSYVVIDGVACRVNDVSTSKTGKHGHAKTRLVAIGILDEKKRELVMPSHDNVEVPIIDKRSAQVLSIVNDKATCMDAESFETIELMIPAELKGQVVEGTTVLYWDVLGTKVMKTLKGGE